MTSVNMTTNLPGAGLQPVAPNVPPAVATSPEVPVTLPAWAIHAAALLTAVSGPLLAIFNPKGHISTAGAQAVITLGTIILGVVIFVIQFSIAAEHKHGWSMATAVSIEQSTAAEIHSLWPEIKSSYTAAAPVLAQLPDIASLTSSLDSLHAKVDLIPSSQRDAAKAAVQEVLGGLLQQGQGTSPQPVTSVTSPSTTPAVQVTPPTGV